MVRRGATKLLGRRIAAAAVVALALVGLVPAGSAAADPSSGAQFNPPKRYYLALGDSIPHGHMWVDGVALKKSYPYLFAERLEHLRSGITVVNYACSGESTGTMIAGGCPMQLLNLPLQDQFTGPQLDAAVDFVRRHSGQVSPITLTIGSGNLRELLIACNNDFACIEPRVPSAIAAFSKDLSFVLGRLRAEAPDAEIIVTGMWSTFVGSFDVSDPLIMSVNAEMVVVASRHGARFANPFPVFNPQGDPDAELAAICTLTRLCSDGDSHPSDAGHAALTELVWDASDYERLGA
jgi:hypothetical protein